MKFIVSSRDTLIGEYEADTPRDALVAMFKDSGGVPPWGQDTFDTPEAYVAAHEETWSKGGWNWAVCCKNGKPTLDILYLVSPAEEAL